MPEKAGAETGEARPTPIEGAERGWQVRDPMRMVRAERIGAFAQIQRSVRAWRKISDAAAVPRIFRSPKGGGNDDDKKDGTPGNNRAQNRQFDDAVQEIQRRIGRNLSADDRRQLHDSISGQNMGYHEIVEEGISLFGHK